MKIKLEQSQKYIILRLALSLVIFITALILPFDKTARFFAIFIAYIIIGYDILYAAVNNTLHGQWLDEQFLMSLASLGAFFIDQSPEAFAVMFFYQLGELFQDIAVGKSRKSIEELLNIVPETAVKVVDGKEIALSPEEIELSDTLLVKPGERVPVDGTVIKGFGALDVAALTGESIPKDIAPNDKIYSGSINLSGSILLRADSLYKDSTVSRIMDLIENSFDKKARSEKFITRFSRYYTPVVVLSALALAFIPPIFIGEAFSKWIERALIFLVASCPCALLVSVPLSFVGGLGSASKNGILIKSAGDLEALSKTDTFVFDKTGTITEGSFEVSGVHSPTEQDANEEHKKYMLDISATLESQSLHPIAVSIKKAHGKEIDLNRIDKVHEHAGKGVSAMVDGDNFALGNATLMEDTGVKYSECTHPGTVVHLSRDKEYLGHILISDKIKKDAKETIARLLELNIKRCIMLSGDRENVVKNVAKEIGIDEYYAELMPEDKVKKVEQFLNEGHKTAFVGDGINDAPVLMRADVGIAMGALGSDAAIESADIVLMDDKLIKLPKALKISKKTMRIVRQNIVISLFIKFLVLILGALGKAPIWAAVFADVGVMILAVFNSLRTMYIK
ncbi:MAG: heavy metal translocating P-type ATPase [Eubacteriales bacterium]|nr:heavy metal translocating P-type ATPase [Eubacteriales bacterium]